MMNAELQDFTDTAVPVERARLKVWYLTSVELAVAICVPVFVFGAQLGGGLPFGRLLLALAISGLLLSIIGGFSSYVGTATRLSTALLARASFGRSGARLIQFALAFSLFGWFGLQTEVFARAFIELLHMTGSSWNPSAIIVTVIAGLLMSSTSVLGIKGVGRLAIIATPFLLLSLAYALYGSDAAVPVVKPPALAGDRDMTLGLAIAGIVGAYSVGLVVRPDIQRFAVSKKQGVSSAVLALGLGYPVLLLISAYLSSVTGEPDFTKLLAQYGFGAFSILMLLLATWTTNDMNLYGASLSLAVLFPALPRWQLTALAGALGTGIACFGLFGHVVALFSFMGVLTTPLLAVYGAEFLFNRRQLESPEGRSGIVWPPFIVWAAASLIGFATTPGGQWGLDLFQLTTVPPLDSLIAAGVMMTALMVLDKKRG